MHGLSPEIQTFFGRQEQPFVRGTGMAGSAVSQYLRTFGRFGAHKHPAEKGKVVTPGNFVNIPGINFISFHGSVAFLAKFILKSADFMNSRKLNNFLTET
jgi:hypothetical protein